MLRWWPVKTKNEVCYSVSEAAVLLQLSNAAVNSSYHKLKQKVKTIYQLLHFKNFIINHTFSPIYLAFLFAKRIYKKMLSIFLKQYFVYLKAGTKIWGLNLSFNAYK